MTTEKINQLLELINDDPDDTTTRFMLAREFIKAKQYPQATEQLQHLINLDPHYTAAYRQLGDAWRLQNKNQQAIQTYYKGIQIAKKTRDLQTAKECRAFLKKLGEHPPEIT